MAGAGGVYWVVVWQQFEHMVEILRPSRDMSFVEVLYKVRGRQRQPLTTARQSWLRPRYHL